MQTLLYEVEKPTKQIRKLQNEFSNMTEYATELQTYAGLKKIEKITSQEGNYIEDLKRGCELNEEITVNTRPCNIQANAGRTDQAQYFVPVQTTDQIKLSFSNTLKVPKRRRFRFVDCCILPDGNIITLGRDDSNRCLNFLLIFKNDGTFIRTIMAFKGIPVSVCFVKDGIVAVSFYNAFEVALVDIHQSKSVRKFQFHSACAGVSSDGKVLIIAIPTQKNVIVMNLKD
ncbi:unnamed protein product [Mytilus coruscus]|uniref:Uncharacterized protein n=1 Tax=Mytilus coruscus TaxID=42192 RepID=A0A6J8B0H2_MYTCO|nr:unnamed protein product [Mytilus coruscus]